MIKLIDYFKILILFGLIAQLNGCTAHEEFFSPQEKQGQQEPETPRKQEPFIPGNSQKPARYEQEDKELKEIAERREQKLRQMREEQKRQDQEYAEAQNRRMREIEQERIEDKKRSDQERAEAKRKREAEFQERKSKLTKYKSELERELPALKRADEAYSWALSLKFDFSSDPGSLIAKDMQAEINAGGQPLRDYVVLLEQYRKNADFPKNNKEWHSVYVGMDRTNKYFVLFTDFLMDYRPGSSGDVQWDYDNIIQLARKRADRIDSIFNSPFVSRTKDYAQLKKEIETILRDKKQDADRYPRVEIRIREIEKTINESTTLGISEPYFNHLMMKI